MNSKKLIETLTFLKENRKLGSEADELIAPFKDSVCSGEFRFESMSRTFANPHDPVYEGGQTLAGELIGTDLDFSLLIPPTENEWAESLERGEEFDGSVKFLGFDGLYQRGIFGYLGKLESEGEDDYSADPDEPDEESDEPVVEEEPVADEDEPVDHEEELVADEEEPLSQPAEEEPETVREEEVQEDQSGDEPPDSEEKVQEAEQEVIEEEPSQSEPDAEESEAISDDLENSGSTPEAGEQATEPMEPEDSKLEGSSEEKELSPKEIARIMDRGKMWGVNGLSKTEQVIYRRESARTNVERWEVERILDKKYEQGIESLTQEERIIYEKEKGARKAKKEEKNRLKLARERAKKKTKRQPESAKKEGPPARWRLFFSFVTAMISLNAIENDASGSFLFFALLSIYSLHPWLAKWMGKNSGEGFIDHPYFREKKFRRGVLLLLLALFSLAESGPVAFVLFVAGLFFLKDSKCVDEFLKKK